MNKMAHIGRLVLELFGVLNADRPCMEVAVSTFTIPLTREQLEAARTKLAAQ